MTTPRDRTSGHYAGVREHERLAALLPASDREWLRRMADVLEPGAVVAGMALRAREGVVPSGGGVRLVRAPAGPAGVGSANRPLPPEAYLADPAILTTTVRR